MTTISVAKYDVVTQTPIGWIGFTEPNRARILRSIYILAIPIPVAYLTKDECTCVSTMSKWKEDPNGTIWQE